MVQLVTVHTGLVTEFWWHCGLTFYTCRSRFRQGIWNSSKSWGEHIFCCSCPQGKIIIIIIIVIIIIIIIIIIIVIIIIISLTFGEWLKGMS